MRNLFAATSSTLIHLCCAVVIYSLWHGADDLIPVQAAEARVVDIGMLMAVEQSDKIQKTQAKQASALAAVDSAPSQKSTEPVEPEAKPKEQPKKKAPEKITKPKPTPTPKPKKAPIKHNHSTRKHNTDTIQKTASQAQQGSGLAKSNQIAQQGTTNKSLGGQGHAQQGHGASYLAGLLNTISKRAAQSYPQQARQMRQQGRVKVAFTLQDDGRLSNIRLLQSSGYHSLDQAALNTLKRLGKYSPPPAGVNRQISTTIVFSLK